MAKASRDFQIFVKPTGSKCNLSCSYCYYLEKDGLYPDEDSFRMSERTLEEYIIQHIEASPSPEFQFSWHGGEPTVLGLEFFRKVVELQRKHLPTGHRITNGIQTNGTLLDEEWCQFLAEEGFTVGLSLDGPASLHDVHRVTKSGDPSHWQTMRGYRLLREHSVSVDILCVVNSLNVKFPHQVYGFFKGIGAEYISFLPIVETDPDGFVSELTVPAEDWGEFLCAAFDEWRDNDIGRIKVQIFEEATRTAFNQEHSLCIFRPTCGDIPVVEHNGDFYTCDHYVETKYRLGNINETSLGGLIESKAQRAFGEVKLQSLPNYCVQCEVRAMCNGECPKNRFAVTPDGEEGLNYLCPGYKRFFTHIYPFVSEVASLWRQGING